MNCVFYQSLACFLFKYIVLCVKICFCFILFIKYYFMEILVIIVSFIWILAILVPILYFIFYIFVCWKVLEKAWQPGWGVLVPFYNIYLMFKVAGRPWCWTRWILFPPVLIVLWIITCFDFAKRFGQPPMFGVWLWFFNPIFLAILAFDKKAVWSPKS